MSRRNRLGRHDALWRARPACFSLVLALPMLLVLLAGCGRLVQGGSSGMAPTSAAPTPTGHSVGEGCPSAQAPADAAALTPDVVVTQETGSAHPVILTHGQHLEIRLAAGVQWRLDSTDPSHALALASAEGWYDGHVNACIWRFSAISAGSARLTFTGVAPCSPPTVRCTPVLDVATFDVTVR